MLKTTLSALGYHLSSRTKDHEIFAYHIVHLIQKYKINIAFDVASKSGSFVEMLRRRTNFKGPIVSFETDAEHLVNLKKLQNKYHLWDFYPYKIGTRSFQGEDGIECRKLDDIAVAASVDVSRPRALIKLDYLSLYSGSEIFAIMGEYEKNINAMIFNLDCARKDEMSGYCEFFYGHGFVMTGVYSRERNPDTLEVKSVDYIFARRTELN